MRVLILADELFASRERSLLTRLEVGLADEGVRVVHAVPESVIERTPGGATDLSGVISKVVAYTPSSIALTRRLVVRQIQGSLEAMSGANDGIDVVHVFGGASWELGLDLAMESGAALVIEAWRAGLAQRAATLTTASHEPPLFIASDPIIERQLRAPPLGPPRAAAPATIQTRCVPWGVLSPAHTRATLETGKPATIMMIGSGRDPRAWGAALSGIAQAAAQGREVLVFSDALAARRSGLWALARSLNFLDRLSLIEELEGRRDLMLHGDILLLPEAGGEQRSIVLESMACGMLIVAASDKDSSVLLAGRTALLVASPETSAWSAALNDLFQSPTKAVALSESAHLFVQVHRKASDHVRGVLGAYEYMTTGETIPFSAP